MGRSIKRRYLFIDFSLLDKDPEGEGRQQKTPIKTWSRRSTITPDFIGLTFTVHNGKIFNPVVRHRKHGEPQAWRISADAHIKKHGAHTAWQRPKQFYGSFLQF